MKFLFLFLLSFIYLFIFLKILLLMTFFIKEMIAQLHNDFCYNELVI